MWRWLCRMRRHCREGYRLAQREPTYRAIVLERLRLELEASPDDLWAAIPWVWALSLGGAAPRVGALAAAVSEASSILVAWLAGDEPIEALKRSWNDAVGAQLALGSTLRSHPFADLRAWSIRPTSAA